MLQKKKACESYQNLCKEEINRKRQYTRKRYINLFIENEPSEEEKTESINMLANYIDFVLKKKTRSVNMLANNKEIFPKKKESKNAKMLANDIEIFLETSEIKKSLLFLEV